MRAPLALCAVIAALGVAAAPASAGSGCGATARPWEERGPYAVVVDRSQSGHTVLRPESPGTRGCVRHPVVLWGNGSGTRPSTYGPLLRNVASHGFVVVAADTPAAGTGREMLAGLDVIAARDTRDGDPLRGHVALDRVATLGHSQGGGGAVRAGADPRVDTVVALQPSALGGIEDVGGPLLLLAGDQDPIIAPAAVEPLFRAASRVPAVYGVLRAADHGTAALAGGGYRGAITTWLRFQLMADERARSQYFGARCRQCTSPAWAAFRRNAKAGAVRGPASARTARGIGLRLRCSDGAITASLTGPVSRIRRARFKFGPAVRERTNGPWRAVLPRGGGGDVIVRVATSGDLERFRRAAPRC